MEFYLETHSTIQMSAVLSINESYEMVLYSRNCVFVMGFHDMGNNARTILNAHLQVVVSLIAPLLVKYLRIIACSTAI